MSGTVTSPNLNQQRPLTTPSADTSSSLLADFIQETLALTKRLFIQLQRRPSTLVAGIIQPLMWLVLFGALFKNAPAGLFGESQNYGQFLGAGVIVFTAFAGALNAGLPIMFDREFGFLNRLLVAPLASRFSIVLASAIFIVTLSFIQTGTIVTAGAFLGSGFPGLAGLGAIALWLQVVVTLNPLSYAIEPIRYLYLHSDWSLASVVMQAPWGTVTFGGALLVLLAFDLVALLSIQPLLRRRFA
ncbi:MAG: ABC transporter permease [Oscillatoriales cyanobacterium]|nr:MAG: ABC transporter permease [Oscillatoriales cyanobacterium]